MRLALLVLLVLMASCRAIRHDYAGDRQLTPGTQLLGPSEEIGAVQSSGRAVFLFFGLLPINSMSGAQLAEDAAVDVFGEHFDGITEIQIREQDDVLDVLVNLLLGPLLSLRSVEVQGNVHRLVR